MVAHRTPKNERHARTPAHFPEWISHAHAHVRPHIARVRVRTHLHNSYLEKNKIQIQSFSFLFVQPLFCALNFCTGIFHGKFDLFMAAAVNVNRF